jgi:hypothetical protein
MTPIKPTTPSPAAPANPAEERFWRSGAGAPETGTVPPEPGSTPAELEPEEEVGPPAPDPAEPS